MGEETRARTPQMRRSTLLVVVFFLGACCPSRHYAGDGSIENCGCWPLSNYRVRFPALRLDRPASSRYHVERLPKLDALLGMEVATPPGLTCEQLKDHPELDGTVLLELARADGRKVVRHAGPLRSWVWSYDLSRPDPKAPPQECFVYAADLYFKPEGLTDLTISITVSQGGRLPLRLVPVVESYAVYLP